MFNRKHIFSALIGTFLLLESPVQGSWIASWFGGGAVEKEDTDLTAFRGQVAANERALGRTLDIVDIIALHVHVERDRYGTLVGLINARKLVGEAAYDAYLAVKDHKAPVPPELVLTKGDYEWAKAVGDMGSVYYCTNKPEDGYADRVQALYGLHLMLCAGEYLDDYYVRRVDRLLHEFAEKNPERELPFQRVRYTLSGTDDFVFRECAVAWAREFGVYETGVPRRLVSKDELRARVVAGLGDARTEEHKSDSGGEEIDPTDITPLLDTERAAAAASGLRHRLVADEESKPDA